MYILDMKFQRFFLFLADAPTFEGDPALYILIGLGAAAVIGLAIFLYFRIFRARSLAKKVGELESMYSTSHGLLFGELATTVHRLEDIQDVNLCYVDEYAKTNRKYKDIRNVTDPEMQAIISELGTLLQDKRIKELRNAIPDAREKITEYINTVNALKAELDEKFKIENSCKELENVVKGKVRNMKMFYNGCAADLKLVVTPLTTAFSNLERALESIRVDIDGARYDEAQETISSVSTMADQLASLIKELPQICVQLSSVLPDKIMRIRTRLEDMTKDGYPLHQIITRSTIDAYNNEIEKMIRVIQQLSIDNISENINLMHSNLDKANELMDKEIEAHTAFYSEKDEILALLSKTQGEYLNLNRDLDKIKQIYDLDDNDAQKLNDIKVLVERSDSSKRTLDTLINSSTKQPYTVMVEKLHLLRDQTIETNNAVGGFTNYLFSLRDDVVKARDTIHDYYLKLKEIELCIHNTGMECIKAKYNEAIDNLYSYIDELYKLLQQRPMQVKLINKIQATIVTNCNALISDLNETVATMAQAEAGIVNANRNRALNVEVDSAVSQAENLFFTGNFAEALTVVTDIRFDNGGVQN